ncbi:hypothetical protein M9H77_08924 [Catharanthus roseus]|uniref:Uncharacterized protein n=1 Tax=Catharanthus roseus TaxID=4058 RepID=A0ACC0BZ56_CATRO|nr:hypothetical protein M9H77_08924 [Catharanthus roseus]
MGSQGPCSHCGTKQSPLWIFGPPDRPVLCNACGTRWKETGTLVDPANKQNDNNEEDPESSLIFEHINKYISEDEIGLGCMLLKLSPESDSKLLAVNTSGSRNRLTGESSKDDVTVLKSEPLGVSAKSTGKSGDNNTCHPMITRLKLYGRIQLQTKILYVLIDLESSNDSLKLNPKNHSSNTFSNSTEISQ